MTEDGKPLETLLEDAARARRLAIVLDGDPAALELERYAEEVEAEIHRRAAPPSARLGEEAKDTVSGTQHGSREDVQIQLE